MGAEVILKQSDPGAPIRMKLSISAAEYGIYFKQTEWNAMVRYSLLGAGQMWMWNYLPLRFTGYARNRGLYIAKKRRGLPLVESGRLREHTLTSSRAEVPHNNKWIDLTIPDTHIIKTFSRKAWKARADFSKGVLMYGSNPVVRTALSRITAVEIQRMATTFDATLQKLINESDKKNYKTGDRKGQIRSMRLTPAARSSLGLKQLARRTPSPTPRR